MSSTWGLIRCVLHWNREPLSNEPLRSLTRQRRISAGRGEESSASITTRASSSPRSSGMESTFPKGQIRPVLEWKKPQKRTAEDSERCYQVLNDFVKHIQTNKQARFVTGRELIELYPENRGPATGSHIDRARIASHLADRLTFLETENTTLSAARYGSDSARSRARLSSRAAASRKEHMRREGDPRRGVRPREGGGDFLH